MNMKFAFLTDFKNFVLRGNVIDLAVGVIIGAAFQGVVKSFVTDILSPLIPSGTTSSFATVAIPIYDNHAILIGDFLNTLVSFVITAAIVYFFVVRPINLLTEMSKRIIPVEDTKRDCPFCLSSIPIKATRCAFCTQEVPPPTAPEATRPTLTAKLRSSRLRTTPLVKAIETDIEQRMQKQRK